MATLLNYLLEANLSLAGLFTLYALLLQKQTCFRFNRVYLLGATIFSWLLPLLSFSLPVGWVDRPSVTVLTTPQTVISWVIPSSRPQPVGMSPWEWAVGIGYGLIVLLLLLRLGYRLWEIKRLIAQYQDQRERQPGYWLIRMRGALPTFSFLQYVCWNENESLSDVEKSYILWHEEAHVRGHHSWDILYLELLRVFCWPSAILALYQMALKQTHEYLADSTVLPYVDRYAYAQLIVRQVARPLPSSLIHPFCSSLIQNRLTMIHRHKQPTRLHRLLLALPITVLLLLTLACQRDMLPTPMAKDSQSNASHPASNGRVNQNEMEGLPAFNKYIGRHLPLPACALSSAPVTSWRIKSELLFNQSGKLLSSKVIECESKEFAPHSEAQQEMWRLANEVLQQASQQYPPHLTVKAQTNRVWQDEYWVSGFGLNARN